MIFIESNTGFEFLFSNEYLIFVIIFLNYILEC